MSRFKAGATLHAHAGAAHLILGVGQPFDRGRVEPLLEQARG